MKTNGIESAYACPAAWYDQVTGRDNFHQQGLTKRELFAAMAMQGICTLDATLSGNKIAEWAVDAADALIAALNAEKPDAPTQQ